VTRLISVAELTTYVRVLFEADELLQDVAVEGEVTQTFTSRAGHIYFTLSDGSVNLKCVMFRGQVARARARIEAGVTVAAFGRVSSTIETRRISFMSRRSSTQASGSRPWSLSGCGSGWPRTDCSTSRGSGRSRRTPR
jgi:exonuclease VII large subunit